MLCYKDQTFCSYYKQCQDGETCHRALIDSVIKQANNADIPISQFGNEPVCFVKNSKK